ncbi:pyridoxal phosphate-dependent decarboxylase family protein [Microbispora bryophytorum]|uniref:pyridoxal phosphate-dependent decarboxylase family protein n=1 Tax=Microbispora bryophytorum TaxID=1460882 RepID=UPI003F4D4F62
MTDDLREAARRAADTAADHLAAVPRGPVWRPVAGPDLDWLTRQPLPAAGRPLAELLGDADRHVLPYPMGNGHPRQRAVPDVRETGLYGRPPLAVYLSEEGHSCLRKAVELLGLGSEHIRTVPVDDAFRMDTAALRRLVAADREAGVRPFFVAASAGTVNTGAVDPLEDVAEVAREHGLWFHVDGAYGALGVLADECRPAYAGLELADSLALDPHKWLGVPVGCGCGADAPSSPAPGCAARRLCAPACSTRTRPRPTSRSCWRRSAPPRDAQAAAAAAVRSRIARSTSPARSTCRCWWEAPSITRCRPRGTERAIAACRARTPSCAARITSSGMNFAQ